MSCGPDRWEVERAAPHPRLRGHVLSYTGYAERAARPVRRLEPPTTIIPVIISLGPSILVDGVRHDSFPAGLGEAAAITEYSGDQLGIQVDLPPLGARRLLGLPLSELARQVVPLASLPGPSLPRFVDRLAAAATWPARFGLLDAFLLDRLDRAPAVRPELEHAWTLLAAGHGAVAVDGLAAQTGWSRRHLTARFTAELGLGPKALGRIMRFERVTDALRAQHGTGLAEIAYDCGYADQAHLNRDFRAFAGTTPTDYAARLLPGGAGVTADAFPNIQDGLIHAG